MGGGGTETRSVEAVNRKRSTTAASSATVRSATLPTVQSTRIGESGNEPVLLTSANAVVMDSRNTSLGSCEPLPPISERWAL